ncbi:MAG TPA: hypothetical protein VHP11_18295 [Tepidisphaeraceae bacterium]|nr:hypothetical protein [Tepidisphaeraceae bacterium]
MKGKNVAGNTANLLQGHCSYIYVGRDLTTTSSPDCVVAFEDPANHVMDGGRVLFADGHVDYVGIGMANFVSELEQGYNPPRQSTQSVAQLRAMYDRDWKPKLAAMKSGQWAQKLPPPRVATTTPTTAPSVSLTTRNGK